MAEPSNLGAPIHMSSPAFPPPLPPRRDLPALPSHQQQPSQSPAQISESPEPIRHPLPAPPAPPPLPARPVSSGPLPQSDSSLLSRRPAPPSRPPPATPPLEQSQSEFISTFELTRQQPTSSSPPRQLPSRLPPLDTTTLPPPSQTETFPSESPTRAYSTPTTATPTAAFASIPNPNPIPPWAPAPARDPLPPPPQLPLRPRQRPPMPSTSNVTQSSSTEPSSTLPSCEPSQATGPEAVAQADALPPLAPLVPPFNPRALLANSPFLSLPNVLFTTAVALLAYFHISPLLVLLLLSAGLALALLKEKEDEAEQQAEKTYRQKLRDQGDHPAPHFLNHTLSLLWPLVNTELFAPMIDLLEDALQTECPPVVSSVRVDSIGLGTRALEVKYLRPLTDDEWFGGLAAAEAAAGEQGTGSAKKTRVIGAEGGNEDHEGGAYSNYEVSFSIDCSKESQANRAGLLVFFGVGIKGMGGVELPVWIDIVKMTGVLRLRLLLDPSPPFVRTATATFPVLPLFEIVALPLKRTGISFNAMKLPGMKWYVLGAIQRVAAAFVSPHAYSLDLDRLLLGAEGNGRTRNIGVLRIDLHHARDLLASDNNGRSDPYVAIGWAKQLKKPLWSSRCVLATLDPVWEETAYLLVAQDAVETGQRLVLQVFDFDRWTADDGLGMIEVDLAEIVQASRDESPSAVPRRRKDKLMPSKRGQVPKGHVDWSVKFYPLWKMDVEPFKKEMGIPTGRKPPSPEMIWPILHLPLPVQEFAKAVVEGEEMAGEKERLKRREETIRWLTGEREREQLELQLSPNLERRTGILAFNIIQAKDLLVRDQAGELDGASKPTAGGKPAIRITVDGVEGEELEPVSSYAEVLLNDRLEFRSRTKRINASPYMNAGAERFVKDWSKERLTIVIRDERDREHDPILGVVDFPDLGATFGDLSEVTRWVSLTGGIGTGLIRVSLLWKAIDISLPRGISSYEIATLVVSSLKIDHLNPKANPVSITSSSTLSIQTESDEVKIRPGHPPSLTSHSDVDEIDINESSLSLSADADSRSVRSARSSFSSHSGPSRTDLWHVSSDAPVRLAVNYRSSTALVLKFSVRQGKIKRTTKTWAIGLLRLQDIPDSEELGVVMSIFETEDIDECLRLTFGLPGEKMEKEIGVVTMRLQLQPGIGKAHSHLLKRDKRLACAEEANRVIAQANAQNRRRPPTNPNVSSTSHSQTTSSTSAPAPSAPTSLSQQHQQQRRPSTATSDDEENDASFDSGNNNDDDDDQWAAGGSGPVEVEEGKGKKRKESFFSKLKNKAQSKRENDKTYQEGILSHKSARSAQWVAANVSNKITSAIPSGRDPRQFGTTQRVEEEGISSF